jgi:cellulose biosynthesis protein BcsQ
MTCGDAPPDLWVVSNRFDCRDRSSGLLDERLRAEWGGKVLETIVHRDDQAEACAERGRTMTNFAPQSPAANSYARLTDEVLVKLR